MERSTELLKQGLVSFQEEGNAWWCLLSTICLALVYVFSGNVLDGEALCQKGFQLIAPGDLHSDLLLKRANAYLNYFKQDYEKAEQLMQENLRLAYQYKHHRGVIASGLTDLCQVALDTNQVDAAEKYIRECFDLDREYGDSYQQAHAVLY